jgi:hypothetical protein
VQAFPVNVPALTYPVPLKPLHAVTVEFVGDVGETMKL